MQYKEDYEKFIVDFNILLSKPQKNWRAISLKVDEFCAEKKKMLKVDYDWVSPYTITKDFTVCVMAHGKKPERALCVINVANGTFKRLKPHYKNTFRHPDPILRIEPNLLQLASTKRGFWVALKETCGEDAFTIHDLKTKNDELMQLYNKYVKFMDSTPSNEKDKKLAYIEQFDIIHYPNESWVKRSLNETKLKDNANTKKRPKLKTNFESDKKRRICDLVKCDEEIIPYQKSVVAPKNHEDFETDVIDIKLELKIISDETPDFDSIQGDNGSEDDIFGLMMKRG